MTFSMVADVREVQGEQVLVRECYVQELKIGVGEVHKVEGLACRIEPTPPLEFTGK